MMKKTIIGLSLLIVVLFMSATLGVSIMPGHIKSTSQNTHTAIDTATKHLLRNNQSVSPILKTLKNMNYTKIRAPEIIFNAIKELTGSNSETKLNDGTWTLKTFDYAFLFKSIDNSNYMAGFINKSAGTAYLTFHHASNSNSYFITGFNGYNATVTTSTGTPIAYIPISPSSKTMALSTIASFDEAYINSVQLKFSTTTTIVRDAPTPCSDCGGGGGGTTVNQYTQTMYLSDSTTTGTSITYDVITVSLFYDSSGITGGSVSVEASYDVNLETPYFTCIQSVKDTVGFSWQITLPSSGSATTSHVYLHDNTQLTYQISIEFGPYYGYYQGSYVQYYDEYQFGTHMYIPGV